MFPFDSSSGCMCGSNLMTSRSVDQLCIQHVSKKSGVISPSWCTPKASRMCPVDTAPTTAAAAAATTSPTAAVAVSAPSGNKTDKIDSSCRHSVTSRHVVAALLTKS